MTDTASFTSNRKRQTAFVVFQGDVSNNAPLPFTAPGWRHCWLMLPAYYPEPGLMATAFTMKLEALRWGVDAAVWWQTPDIVAGAFWDAGVTAIVEFPFSSPPKNPENARPRLLTCVSLTKAVLQIDAPFVWTPKQLFAYLVRNGGRLHK